MQSAFIHVLDNFHRVGNLNCQELSTLNDVVFFMFMDV